MLRYEVRPGLQQRINERYVSDERGLRLALSEIADNYREVGNKTIVLTSKVFIKSPIVLNSNHSGLILRAIGRELGVFPDASFSAATLGSMIEIPSGQVPVHLTIRDMTLGNGSAANFALASAGGGASFLLDNLLMHGINGAFQILDANKVTIRTVEGLGGTTSSLLQGCTNVWVSACNLGLEDLTINRGSTFNLTNNSIGALTTTATTSGVILVGNHFFGGVDTSLGAGATVVGNYMNGNTLTTGGSDTATGNHA